MFSIERSIGYVRLKTSDDDDKLNSYSTKEKKQNKKTNKSLDWQRQGEQKQTSAAPHWDAVPDVHLLESIRSTGGLFMVSWPLCGAAGKTSNVKNKVHRVLESRCEKRDPSGEAEIDQGNSH